MDLEKFYQGKKEASFKQIKTFLKMSNQANRLFKENRVSGNGDRELLFSKGHLMFHDDLVYYLDFCSLSYFGRNTVLGGKMANVYEERFFLSNENTGCQYALIFAYVQREISGHKYYNVVFYVRDEQKVLAKEKLKMSEFSIEAVRPLLGDIFLKEMFDKFMPMGAKKNLSFKKKYYALLLEVVKSKIAAFIPAF